MKRLVLFLAILILTACASEDNDTNNNQPTAQRTNIPDPNFEQALIDLGFDNTLDGSVLTSNIDMVMDLVVNEKGISDFNGIQDFTNLYNLWANGNNVSTINLSANTRLKFIFLNNNNLSDINVQNQPDLEKLSLSNNNLSTINTTNINPLQQLIIDGNNLSQLDVSTNPNLTVLDSRNNTINCIIVNDNQLNNIPNDWLKDNSTIYSTSCN